MHWILQTNLFREAEWANLVAALGLPPWVVGLTAGPHLSLPLVDAGLEFGYFSNFEKFGIVPSVSVGLLKFDLMASYTIVNADPKANWVALGAGLRF